MEIQDDRTDEQKLTHEYAVVGTDPFMSGWGEATGGVSYAAWACKLRDFKDCDRWVRERGDMHRVRQVLLPKYRPTGKGHLHIYVWTGPRERS